MVSVPKVSKTERAASLPIAASQLMELSNREAGGQVHGWSEEALERYGAGFPAGVDRGEPVLGFG